LILFSELYDQLPAESSKIAGVSHRQLSQQNIQLQVYKAGGWSACCLNTTPGSQLQINWSDFILYRIAGTQVCLRSLRGEFFIFPNQAQVLQLDEHKRIRAQDEKQLPWHNSKSGLQFKLNATKQEVLHINLIQCPNQEAAEQWFDAHEAEKTCWAVEGSWTEMQAPQGFFDYWLFGVLYSKRFSSFGRFPSGQDAFSLFRIAALLFHRTQRSFYRFFMQILALSLHRNQADDGSWPNGEWLSQPEVHTRFNIDGARLLQQAGFLFNEKCYAAAAKANLHFFVQKADVLDQGALWYLHDACEFKADAFKQKHKHALKHQAYGKSAHNALVLNTHLQTLLLIAEMQASQVDEDLAQWEQKGFQALEMTLKARPATARYRLADFLLQNILSVEKAVLPIRLLRRYGFKHLYKIYWLQKQPRFISPAGFIYRDAALPLYGYWYHFVNIYDLQQLYHYRPKPYLREALQKALAYPGNNSLAEFLLHYGHYLAPQWWQIQHLAKMNTKAYAEALLQKGYGKPPETQLEEGLFTPQFWQTLREKMT